MDMNLSKPWETVKNRRAWQAAVHGVTKRWSLWATHRMNHIMTLETPWRNFCVCVCVCVYVCAQSCLTLATPWTAAPQAPQSMTFSRQEYWSRWPFPFPGDLPDRGIEPSSLVSPALASGFFTSWATRKPMEKDCIIIQTQSGNTVLVKDLLS